MLSCEFNEIFKNTFFYRTLPVAGSAWPWIQAARIPCFLDQMTVFQNLMTIRKQAADQRFCAFMISRFYSSHLKFEKKNTVKVNSQWRKEAKNVNNVSQIFLLAHKIYKSVR